MKEATLSSDQSSQPTQFPLRLPKSLKGAANAAAKEQGISLNHFISLAVSEKIVALDIKASLKRTAPAKRDEA